MAGDVLPLDDVVQHYPALRKIARRALSLERRNHSLQATELVNDWFRELIEQGRVHFNDTNHMFYYARRAFANMLKDHARKKKAKKREGEWTRLSLSAVLNLAADVRHDEDLALQRALEKFAVVDPRATAAVSLRYLEGYTENEIAAQLGCCERTVREDCRFARAWLLAELAGNV